MAVTISIKADAEVKCNIFILFVLWASNSLAAFFFIAAAHGQGNLAVVCKCIKPGFFRSIFVDQVELTTPCPFSKGLSFSSRLFA